jgi:hypothetical protein
VIREACVLVKNGVLFDTAFGMDDDWRQALCVVFGELEGMRFNWATMAFEEPKS